MRRLPCIGQESSVESDRMKHVSKTISVAAIAKVFVFARRDFTRLCQVLGRVQSLRLTVMQTRKHVVTKSIHVPDIDRRVEVRLGRGQTDLRTFIHVFCDSCYEFHLGHPSWIIDAGANVGYSTLWFALEYPSAQVVALEPEPENFQVATRNLKGLPNVHLLNVGLMDFNGKGLVIETGLGPDAFRVIQGDSTWTTGEVVASIECVNVESIIERFGIRQVDLLKMDIEGSEVEVFQSSQGWIGEVNAIVAEMHDRFRPGAMRSFMNATNGFVTEVHRGENIFVSRHPLDLSKAAES